MWKRTLWQLAVAAGLLIPASWATAGGPPPDGALAALVSETLAGNPRVQAAAAALAAGEARQRGAEQPLYNPELEADFEKADVRTSSVGLRQAIDWTDKREALGGIAAAEREALAAELADVRQALAAELLSSLVDFHTRLELERLAGQRTELTGQFLAVARRRHEAGDLPQVEVDMAQLAAQQALILKAKATTARVEAVQDLVALTGGQRPAWPALPEVVPEAVPAAMPGAMPDAVTDDPAVDPGMDLLRLPALRAQQARINAARQTVRLKRRESRPDPTIGVRGGREDSEGLVGVTFSIPLFIRNDFKAGVAAADAEAASAGSRLQDMARQARARLVSTSERYRLTREAWLAWREAGEFSLQRQTTLLQRLWQAGELSTTDYLVQLAQSLDTQADATELHGDLWHAWVDWLAASGGVESWLGLEASATTVSRTGIAP